MSASSFKAPLCATTELVCCSSLRDESRRPRARTGSNKNKREGWRMAVCLCQGDFDHPPAAHTLGEGWGPRRFLLYVDYQGICLDFACLQRIESRARARKRRRAGPEQERQQQQQKQDQEEECQCGGPCRRGRRTGTGSCAATGAGRLWMCSAAGICQDSASGGPTFTNPTPRGLLLLLLLLLILLILHNPTLSFSLPSLTHSWPHHTKQTRSAPP
jgi:hypothetical protein